MSHLSPTQIVWEAAGRPVPCDSTGEPIPERGSGHCAACGAPAEYAMDDTISENFTTVKNSSRGWPFGGSSTCSACVFSARTLRLRCVPWWATASGIRFWESRGSDGVLELCSPPEPPFVAAIPLAGMAHGGEKHWRRTWWPGEQRPEGGYLVRLQSKHVAIYARASTSRERYPLQVDDQHDIVVDVALWRELHEDASALIRDMAAAGVWASAQASALKTLRPPPKCTLGLVRDWNARTRLMRRHLGATWWPLFAGLMPIRRIDDE